MKKNAFRILFPIGALILLVLVLYSYKKNHSSYALWGQQYEKGLKIIYDKRNYYCPEAQLAFYDSCLELPSLSFEKIEGLMEWKALAFLKMGEEKTAIDLLEKVVKNSSMQGKSEKLNDARRELAMAYLRLGEKSNCVSGHSSESCIFPLSNQGIYSDPYASQKAIDIYQEILEADSTDLESRWLLNLAYMTIGEYPLRVPAHLLIPGLDKDTSSVRVKPFSDRSTSLGLNRFRSQAGGSIVEDFNNDGYFDIVVSSMGLNESMHYFKNNGNGSFTDESEKSGLNKIKGGLNIIQADYNNDGYTDILVLRGGWGGDYGKQPNSLLRNNGNGTFTDVTLESGLLSFRPTQTGAWADFNNDGWLDLYIGNETGDYKNLYPSELYINNQDGTFTNVTAASGSSVLGYIKGVVADDYNKDGWPDIFISTRNGKKYLLKNTGAKSGIPKFVDATHEAGLDKDLTYTFPTCFMDYDNDGWPDIFVCGYRFDGPLAATAAKEALGRPLGNESKMYLYRNNHDGTFTNVSKSMGLDHPVFAMGFNFGDIDNDGWLDMYMGTGNPDFQSLIPNRMFRNVGGHQFVDVTQSARVGNLQKGHGVAFADIDNDGDQDIFSETGGAFVGDAYYNSLYVNPEQNTNEWISVQLEGTTSNRSAIGATISVSFTEDGMKRTVFREINSGGSFGASPFRKEIGIGKARTIDELIIKWPTSGIVQVFKNISPCRFLKIKEGSNQLQYEDLKTLRFSDRQVLPMIGCAPPK